MSLQDVVAGLVDDVVGDCLDLDSAPAIPPPPLRAVLASWEASKDESWEALHSMSNSMHDQVGGELQQNVSLVEYAGQSAGSREVSFVHWINADASYGQSVHVDGNGRFITMIPLRNTKKSSLMC